MRKIEQEMMMAIKSKTDWQRGNTAVYIERGVNTYGTRAEVYLHGNHIASYWYGDGCYCPTRQDNKKHDDDPIPCLDVDIRTLKQWPTMTTKSRLRVLGAHLVTKQGKLYLNGEVI